MLNALYRRLWLSATLLCSLPLMFCACGIPATALSASAATASPVPARTEATPAPARPADRAKFLGSWNGPYACEGAGVPIEDEITVAAGEKPLEVKLTLFMKITSAPALGTLTDANTITIKAQKINGFSTSGSLRFAKGKLTLKLHGLGVDCLGENYQPLPESDS